MAGKFNLEDYDTVESRVKKFWEQYPSGESTHKYCTMTITASLFRLSFIRIVKMNAA